MELINCPLTGASCGECESVALRAAKGALKERNYDEDILSVMSDEIIKKSVAIVTEGNQPDWAVRERIVSCDDRLESIKSVIEDVSNGYK